MSCKNDIFNGPHYWLWCLSLHLHFSSLLCFFFFFLFLQVVWYMVCFITWPRQKRGCWPSMQCYRMCVWSVRTLQCLCVNFALLCLYLGLLSETVSVQKRWFLSQRKSFRLIISFMLLWCTSDSLFIHSSFTLPWLRSSSPFCWTSLGNLFQFFNISLSQRSQDSRILVGWWIV